MTSLHHSGLPALLPVNFSIEFVYISILFFPWVFNKVTPSYHTQLLQVQETRLRPEGVRAFCVAASQVKEHLIDPFQITHWPLHSHFFSSDLQLRYAFPLYYTSVYYFVNVILLLFFHTFAQIFGTFFTFSLADLTVRLIRTFMLQLSVKCDTAVNIWTFLGWIQEILEEIFMSRIINLIYHPCKIHSLWVLLSIQNQRLWICFVLYGCNHL